jgi:hypothetical protein
MNSINAIRFKNHFKDLFEGVYIRAGERIYNDGRKPSKLYVVARIPRKDEPTYEGFEGEVESGEILREI